MPLKPIDISGQRFGRLVAVRIVGFANGALWECHCDCGATIQVPGGPLRAGGRKSCGCITKLIDLTGQRFGRLTVIQRAPNSPRGQARWKCRCDCGSVVAAVIGRNLTKGQTQSCGCRAREVARGLMQSNQSPRRLIKRIWKHGGSYTSEYRIWAGMKTRCLNARDATYARYGARGITICARWVGRDGFKNFLADMGPRPGGKSAKARALYSIDRIDNNGPYSPDNCRWATASEQMKNRNPFPRHKKAH